MLWDHYGRCDAGEAPNRCTRPKMMGASSQCVYHIQGRRTYAAAPRKQRIASANLCTAVLSGASGTCSEACQHASAIESRVRRELVSYGLHRSPNDVRSVNEQQQPQKQLQTTPCCRCLTLWLQHQTEVGQPGFRVVRRGVDAVLQRVRVPLAIRCAGGHLGRDQLLCADIGLLRGHLQRTQPR